MKKLIFIALLMCCFQFSKANSIFVQNLTSCTYVFYFNCHDAVNTGCGVIIKQFTIMPGVTIINDPSTYGATFQVGMNTTYATSGTATWDEMKGGLAGSCFQSTIGFCLAPSPYSCSPMPNTCTGNPTLNMSWNAAGPNVLVVIN